MTWLWNKRSIIQGNMTKSFASFISIDGKPCFGLFPPSRREFIRNTRKRKKKMKKMKKDKNEKLKLNDFIIGLEPDCHLTIYRLTFRFFFLSNSNVFPFMVEWRCFFNILILAQRDLFFLILIIFLLFWIFPFSLSTNSLRT